MFRMLQPKKSKDKQTKSVVFYALYIPLLIILAVLLAGVGNFTTKKPLTENIGNVLSSGSGSDGDGHDSDDDDDDDDDDDHDDDGDDDDDDDDDHDDDDDDDDFDDFDDDFNDGDDDDFRPSNSGSGNFNDGNQFEFEQDDDGFKSKERTLNSDGTFSIIEKEVDGDKIRIKIKTYDANGNKISESEYRVDEDGKTKIKLRTKNSDGQELSDLRIEFPGLFSRDNGRLSLDTPEGKIEIRAAPNVIIRAALGNDDIDEVEDISLDDEDNDTDDDSKVRYKVRGIRRARLLGLFEISIPTTLFFDLDGNLIEEHQSLLAQLLDLLSPK